jgi:hypothetical protein
MLLSVDLAVLRNGCIALMIVMGRMHATIFRMSVMRRMAVHSTAVMSVHHVMHVGCGLFCHLFPFPSAPAFQDVLVEKFLLFSFLAELSGSRFFMLFGRDLFA